MTTVQRRAMDNSGGKSGKANTNKGDRFRGAIDGFGVLFRCLAIAERDSYDQEMGYGYPSVAQFSYEEAFQLGEEALHPMRHRPPGPHHKRHYPHGYERDLPDRAEERRLYRNEVEVSRCCRAFHSTSLLSSLYLPPPPPPPPLGP